MSTLEPERGAGTGTLVEPTPQVSHGDGDHERFAHYVQKDKIMESALSGSPVVALCGKVWVPGRDPKKYPVCRWRRGQGQGRQELIQAAA